METPVKWADNVRDIYRDAIGDDIPEYIKTLKISDREFHGTEKLKEEDLFVSNTEVTIDKVILMQ